MASLAWKVYDGSDFDREAITNIGTYLIFRRHNGWEVIFPHASSWNGMAEVVSVTVASSDEAKEVAVLHYMANAR